ncbi:MAG: hypothetical protein V4689_16625 [Verrucomicrobiota bacterium]
MKTRLKYLIVPVLCQTLFCAPAFAAKKDDADDKKDSRKEQTTQKKAAPAQPRKAAQQGGQKAAPKPNAKPNQEPQAKKKAQSSVQKNTDRPAKPKAEPAPSKKNNPPTNANNGSNREETRTTKNSPSGKGSKNTEPMTLPGKRPSSDTADNNKNKANKPMPLPGKRPNAPVVERSATKQVAKNTNADGRVVGTHKKGVVRPGQNSQQIRRPDFQKNTNNNWWNNNRTTKNVQINNRTVINNNFQRNVNWNTSRRSWGYNPWWNRPQVRPWYSSSWNGSWNRNYYRHSYSYGYYGGYRPPGYVSVGTAIGWGLVGWSLGAMVYDSGYRSYYNPYPVRTEVVYRGGSYDYNQPITRVAVNTAPADNAAVEEITRKSESIIAESQSAFKERNYLVALELADKAIAESPGDGALHEYRALVLFALGKYGDAAGVLNPVLASGPGWDWSTMIALYDSQQTYTDQLQRLETYTEEKPDSADTHFLLGYHYMVCGHLDLATPQFDLATKLMPSDSVSKELAELTRSTAKPDEETEPAEDEKLAEAPLPDPVPLEKLTGTWVSNREKGGSVTLTFKDDGKFTWSYVNDGKATEFAGNYSINDDGLLVLDSDESQMVASVALPQDSEMKFVLAGGPPEDPGLAFTKG